MVVVLLVFITRYTTISLWTYFHNLTSTYKNGQPPTFYHWKQLRPFLAFPFSLIARVWCKVLSQSIKMTKGEWVTLVLPWLSTKCQAGHEWGATSSSVIVEGGAQMLPAFVALESSVSGMNPAEHTWLRNEMEWHRVRLESSTEKKRERERVRERQGGRTGERQEREGERHTQRGTHREVHTERHTHRGTHTEAHTQRGRKRYAHTHTGTER